MQKLWALEVLKSKRNPNLDLLDFPNYFPKEKSDYCAMTTSAMNFRELKNFKRKSDMWGPHVSEMAHGELGSPSHWILVRAGLPRGAHVAHTRALTGLHARKRAEVASHVSRHASTEVRWR